MSRLVNTLVSAVITSAALGTVAAIVGLGAAVIDVLQDYGTTSSITVTVMSDRVDHDGWAAVTRGAS